MFTIASIEPETNTSNVQIITDTQDIFKLPNDYFAYVDSYTVVTKTYNWETTTEKRVLPNILGNREAISKFVSDGHDALRIMRNPIVVLFDGGEPKWKFKKDENNNDELISDASVKAYLLHDRFTTVESLNLHYYKMPVYFDVMTSVPCELPIECFDDLVSGAVDLYINYLRGGIRQQEEEGRRDRFNRRQAQREAEQDKE